MCGIAGHWPSHDVDAREIGIRMAQAIHHRGPDDAGVWAAPGEACLAHRRLSIIDLTRGGHQPMASHDRRLVIAFNGEIYNFAYLRRDLESTRGRIQWRGHSDTEVLVEAFATWGVAATLPRLNGMFAIALWDGESKSLTLARDRFGEKPLYYGYIPGGFVFGSELKALYAHPKWRASVDRDAVADFLRLSYVPAPRTIFTNIRKLMPGCFITLQWPDIARQQRPREHAYWRADHEALQATIADASDAELIDETQRKLQDAVKLRMVSDVPLGAFLSGGIDSSAVVATMQSLSSVPVKTFSIGFADSRYDEAGHAARVASHLGTDHTQLYVTDGDVLDTIPELPSLYDEPFADSSQIPTVLVSRMARKHVTVALTGDGGDELFGGYNRHAWVPRVWRMASRLPTAARAGLGQFLLRSTPAQLDASFARLQRLLPSRLHVRTAGDKLHKLASVLTASGPREIYAGLVSTIHQPQRFMAHPAAGTANGALFPENPRLTTQQWMMLADTCNYMVDDILTKVDRASMSVSLEARIPMLDPELYAWAWRLPMRMKIRGGQGKWVLRQVLYRHVPQALVDRPKAGFGMPLDAMLRGPLHEWARDVLNTERLREQNLLDARSVCQALDEHMEGGVNHAYLLWNTLALTAWFDANRHRIDS